MKVTMKKAKPNVPVVRKPIVEEKIESIKVEATVEEVKPVVEVKETPTIDKPVEQPVEVTAPVANNPITINRKPPKPKPKYVKPITAADPPKVEEKKEDTLEVARSIKVADIKPVEVKETPITPVQKPAPKKVIPKQQPKPQENKPKIQEEKKVTRIVETPAVKEEPKNNGVTFKPIFRDEPNPNTENKKSNEDLGALAGLADILSNLFVTKAELPALVEKIINDLLIKNNK